MISVGIICFFVSLPRFQVTHKNIMNVDLLSKMVKELILDNEKVVLPGLGVFVAEMEPSTFSDRGYTINPPYRRLYFRTREEDSTMLRDFYADSNGIDRELAGKILDDFLKELKVQLKLKKNIILPGLGKLRATKENNIFFVADENMDIYPDGVGLEPISLKSHQEKEEDVAEAVINLRTMINVPESPSENERVSLSHELSGDSGSVVNDNVTGYAVSGDAISGNAISGVESISGEAISGKDEMSGKEELSGEEDVSGELSGNVIPVDSAPDVAESMPEERKTGLDRKWKTAIIILLSLVIAAILFMIIFLVLAQICPEFIDSILYNEEELEILNY